MNNILDLVKTPREIEFTITANARKCRKEAGFKREALRSKFKSFMDLLKFYLKIIRIYRGVCSKRLAYKAGSVVQ